MEAITLMVLVTIPLVIAFIALFSRNYPILISAGALFLFIGVILLSSPISEKTGINRTETYNLNETTVNATLKQTTGHTSFIELETRKNFDSKINFALAIIISLIGLLLVTLASYKIFVKE